MDLSVLLLIFFISFTISTTSVTSLNGEALSLLSFKSAILEDPEASLATWNSSSSSSSSAQQDPCSWNGITCKQSSVVSITIPRKRLSGSLTSSLGSLTSLRHINLRNNRLFGPLPAGLFSVRGLQSVVLYGNFLSGAIPPEIGRLAYLQILDLSQNNLSGSLPDSLLQCKRLRALVLARNNFSDTLPDGFGKSLVLLEKLDLSYNRFNGPIPEDIGNLSGLQGTADFSHNQFAGSIPPSLGNLPEKVYIDLTYNNLSGAIPQNGALVNRGPTAFLGNPGLCGPPLKQPCDSSIAPSSMPSIPGSLSPPGVDVSSNIATESGKRINKNVVIAIVLADVVGIALIALVFFCCYRKATRRNKNAKGKRECLCFRNDESDTMSENVEHLDLVPLDPQVRYDLDELLKASAFVLGKSGIGIVYKVVLEGGLTLAVRRLGEGGSQRFKEFQTEVEAIGKVRHPNIVPLRAYYWSTEEKLLIYDYIPNGNLSEAIHGKPGMVTFTPLSWDVRLKIMKGLAKGLAFLHEFSPKKYVHGDLKPSNVLLGANMEPYISDFGLGHLINITGGSPLTQSSRMNTEKPQSRQSDVAISPIMSTLSCYQAPEALHTLKPSQKWDVYSYGVIVLELISARSPIVVLDTSEMDLVRWIQFCIEEKKPLIDVLDPLLSPDLDKEDEIIAVLKVALACVQANPERRPSMRHVTETLDRIRR